MIYPSKTILVPHRPAEVMARLTAAGGEYRSKGLFAPFRLLVRDEEQFQMVRTRWFFRNSFAPVLFGRVQPERLGSRIQCRFMVHPAVLALTALMIVVPCYSFLRHQMAGMSSPSPDAARSMLSMPVFVVLILLVGHLLGIPDRRTILAELHRLFPGSRVLNEEELRRQGIG